MSTRLSVEHPWTPTDPALLALREGVDAALARALRRAPHWGEPAAMSRALAGVRRAFNAVGVEIDEPSCVAALSYFRRRGQFPGFTELKYGCFALGLPIPLGALHWTVLGDEVLLRRLLQQVDEQAAWPRRFRKCYQGLVQSYCTYPLLDAPSDASTAAPSAAPSAELRNNWRLLRIYLAERLPAAQRIAHPPRWLQVLGRHAELFGQNPCASYAAELLTGSPARFLDAVKGIGIRPDSWFCRDTLEQATRTVAAVDNDGDFQKQLPALLALLEGSTGVVIDADVQRRCLSLVLKRDAACAHRPPQELLRGLALRSFGDPDLPGSAWDGGMGDEAALPNRKPA